MLSVLTTLLGCQLAALGANAQSLEPRKFADPPATYRPTVTTEEGAGYAAPLGEAARRAIYDLDAGSIMISPQGDPTRRKALDAAGIAAAQLGLLDAYPQNATPWLPKALPGEARFGSYLADGRAGPGPGPNLGYMTPEWFAAMRELLEVAKRNGRFATFYDEAGFPSGSADHTIPARLYRKLIRREEVTISPSQTFVVEFSADTRPFAVVALDSTTGKRVDLLSQAANDRILWIAPKGNWRVQSYYIGTSTAKPLGPDYYGTADYLDPDASRWFIENVYDRAHRGLSEFFGSTIRYTFFDDVGIYSDEKTWHPAVAERFEKITGQPATLYYPALWDDIGPDTAAARVGFFKARAELLGETFPKLITDWAHAHGVKSTGHAPGNYDLQPTDTIGDPFKFYAYTDMPMADVLWGIGFARGGFKLISSVSAQRDLPLTAAEAFSVNNDANGYRRMIELYTRGFNHFITGARQPSKPRGTGAELNRWAGRSSYLLQGGKHVADIAIVFPIESLQAFYSFNAPGNSAGLPAGVHAYRDADYQAVGEMLHSELHRDFTFVHPDALGGDKLQVRGNELVMQNKMNRESYRVVILPGGEVLSVAALEKIKAFYDAGGTVVATSLLPKRSAEFGADARVKELVAAIFGDTPGDAREPEIRRNTAGGQAVFLAQPSAALLAATFDRLELHPDVAFHDNPTPSSGNGVFGYIHRQRDGKDIYYFGNSSDTPVETIVSLRGRLSRLQLWNPHDGKVTDVSGIKYRSMSGGTVTEFRLSVPAVSSVAIVGKL
ncbi:glycosyl hydrolase [Steroidobacter flavus]|uniref:Glycosyl hydrolase n=1 Tax=Steroidobacter flavus TaxID=1842136 RepID=A0ABV8SYF2_9GAMM